MKMNRYTNIKLSLITILFFYHGFTQKIIAQTSPSDFGGFYLYNNCGTASSINCGDNTLSFSNTHTGGNAIVWYAFNTTTTVNSSIYFSSNTANIYSIGIFGPFATTSASVACSDSSMLNAQWPSGGIYFNSFTAASNYTTPVITFAPGFYIFHVRYLNYPSEPSSAIFNVNMSCVAPQIACENCIGSFAPQSGEYVLSAWVKEEINDPTILSYTNPKIYVDFPSTSSPSSTPSAPGVGPYTASGSIIDGWQRIEVKFTIPSAATFINLRLECGVGNCFFDDIRIFPVNGSMKSYVYDPTSLRLVAELDERNYATLYEYDEEGKLVRVKKETEKGVMTIKENKNSTKKR